MPRSVSELGYRSALIAGLSSLAFTLTGLLGLLKVLRSPWNPVLPDAASFVLAIAFVVMMACIHESASRKQRVWSLAALAIAILYASMVCLVYMTVITFVTPALARGQIDRVDTVAPFVFDDHGSFMQAVDGAGYFFQCLATLFAAPVFAGAGRQWIRRVFVANGIVGFFVLLAYMPLVVPSPLYQATVGFAALWIVTLPVAALLAARYFQLARHEPMTPRRPASAAAPA